MENILNVIFPIEIIDIIKSYVPYHYIVFTNKSNYYKYHKYLKSYIYNYDKFIHFIIRKDYTFVFERIFDENKEVWIKMNNYQEDNLIYANYLEYIYGYCIQNESNKCIKCIKSIKNIQFYRKTIV
jgi:hypothetical protein